MCSRAIENGYQRSEENLDCANILSRSRQKNDKKLNGENQEKKYVCFEVDIEPENTLSEETEVNFKPDYGEAAKLFLPPSPYYLPGYTGFCPQVKHRIGKTYGNETHRVLVDNRIAHSKEMRLAEIEYQPPDPPFDYLAEHCKKAHCVWHLPLSMSYKGYIPRLQHFFGLSTAAAWNCSLTDFAKIRMQRRSFYEKIEETQKQSSSNRPIPVIEVTPDMLNEIKSKLQ